MNKVVGIIGWQNSGKTTLVVELVKHLVAKGLNVSTVKHAHHAFDIDKPGKDSFKHREAGAREVMVASDTRWALMRELESEMQPSLPDLVSRMADADIILAEGFKSGHHPKIEVWRDPETELLARTDPNIIAVIAPSGVLLHDCPCPVLARDDLTLIADLVHKTCGVQLETQGTAAR
ncbi:MAG: molybdopterin-guanine dinucleotide biosynthesis protein B [Rhodobiaceae bacterium]|nr:molybdopterin-guanine dinucleotide biosynthesis protein B [Rhodobiaceae bacterium]